MRKNNFPTFVCLSVLFLSLVSACSSDELADGLGGLSLNDGKYHAAGWVAPTQHGTAYIGDMSSCAECHAADLSGGISKVSCQQCHGGWTKRCDFCHGGGAGNLTAAPDSGAHLAHVKNAALHLAYACDTCHKVPDSIEAEGHIDGEAGSELVFSDKVGSSAAYSDGKCSSVYCHGGVQIAWNSGGPLACDACHASAENASSLSGDHASHIALGINCSACHAAVVANNSIKDRALHTDGLVSVDFAQKCGAVECNYDFETKNCTQSCHSQAVWGGAYHPQGWAGAVVHGYAFERAEGKACADCHGADLAGGSSGVSCDQCHSGGNPSWRSDCTFCHGGAENSSGAPPEGVFGESLRSERAVGAHRAHIQAGPSHEAFGCEVCHPAYSSMADAGHINQQRTVVFGGFNEGAEYRSEGASCSALYCHGNGRDASSEISWTSQTSLDCSGCHGYYEKRGLSGKHSLHLAYNLKCADCHKSVIGGSNNLLDKPRHIDGNADVELSSGQWNADQKTCTNTCHQDSSW